VLYRLNTTAYSLVAWRVTQPVIRGVSSYGCFSELCEQLSTLGVPVVPTSLVVEPDGYGKWQGGGLGNTGRRNSGMLDTLAKHWRCR
jgi:hypothetical protein